MDRYWPKSREANALMDLIEGDGLPPPSNGEIARMLVCVAAFVGFCWLVFA